MLDKLAPGNHLCLLYDSLDDWLRVIPPLIKSGIRKNHKILYVSSDNTREELASLFSSSGLDTEALVQSGQVVIMEAGQAYTPDGVFDTERTSTRLALEADEAVKQGYQGLIATGEMSWTLKGISSSKRFNEYESRLNSALSPDSSCITVCQYDLRSFPPESIREIIRTHPKIIFGGRVLDNCYYIPPSEYLDDARVDSEVKHWLEHLVDIRARQADLEESEALYRTMVDMSSEVGESILMLQDTDNREGVITFASPQFYRMTGCKKEDLLEMSFFDLLMPEEREASIDRHRRKMQGESLPELHEMTIIRKDGSQIPVEFTSASTKYHGKTANIAYIRDITERKKAEEELKLERDRAKTYLDVAAIMIVALDVNQRVSLVNRKGCQVLGYSPEEIIGKKWTDSFIPAENREEVNAVFSQQLFSGVKEPAGNQYENHVLTKNGQIRTIEWYNGILKDAEGNVVGGIASGRDVTELRKAERALEMYREHLEELVGERTLKLEAEIANRQKAEEEMKELWQKEADLRNQLEEQMKERARFMRAMAHEMKTPIAALLASSDLITENLSLQQISKVVKEINRGAVDLNKRVNELFDFTKGEIGMLYLRETDIKPGALFSEVLASFTALAKQKNITLQGQWANDLPIIRADRQRIIQVLDNLLNNAIRHTSHNGTITLRATVKEQAFLIQVEDNGSGIPKESLEEIFQPYHKANSINGQYEGMGLGLALSRMFTELHSGHIWAESTEGRGSTFNVTLPLRKNLELND
jgi:PAS domain S-box-containing protein